MRYCCWNSLTQCEIKILVITEHFDYIFTQTKTVPLFENDKLVGAYRETLDRIVVYQLNWIMCRVWLLGVKIDTNDCEIFVENWFAILCLSVQRFPSYVMHLSLH